MVSATGCVRSRVAVGSGWVRICSGRRMSASRYAVAPSAELMCRAREWHSTIGSLSA